MYSLPNGAIFPLGWPRQVAARRASRPPARTCPHPHDLLRAARGLSCHFSGRRVRRCWPSFSRGRLCRGSLSSSLSMWVIVRQSVKCAVGSHPCRCSRPTCGTQACRRSRSSWNTACPCRASARMSSCVVCIPAPRSLPISWSSSSNGPLRRRIPKTLNSSTSMPTAVGLYFIRRVRFRTTSTTWPISSKRWRTIRNPCEGPPTCTTRRRPRSHLCGDERRPRTADSSPANSVARGWSTWLPRWVRPRARPPQTSC